MEVKVKFSHLSNCIRFLQGLSLKGKKSIHCTRFANHLTEQLKKVADEELELVKQFAGEDEKGEPIRDENGNFAIKDIKAFKKEQEDYLSEYFTVKGGDSHGMLKTMKEVIENYDGEVSGQDAIAFEHLYTAFENVSLNEKGAEE